MSDNIIYKNRIGYIDELRGLGIIFMVIGHIVFSSIIQKSIYSFHMPLFFFIGGYLFKKGNNNIIWLSFTKKQFKKLIIPYYIVGFCYFIFWIFSLGLKNNLSIEEYFVSFIVFSTRDTMPIAGSIWFLPCFFIVSILFNLLSRNLRDLNLFFCMGIIFILGCVYSSYVGVRLPWGFDTGLIGVFIYYLGYLFRYSKNRIIIILQDMSPGIVFLAVITQCLLISFNIEINMRKNIYGNYIIFLFGALIGILIWMSISKMINSYAQNCSFLRGSNNILRYIGRNTIIFLCSNELIILICRKIIERTIVNIAIQKVLILITSLIMMLLLSFGWNRFKEYNYLRTKT